MTHLATSATTIECSARPGPRGPDAIFVVGVPRSGTTMMRAVLETSDRIAVARENHFMGHVLGRGGARHFFRRAGDPTNDDAIRKIVDLIYSGEYERRSGWRRPSPFWPWLTKNVPREEMERRLLAAERTERGMSRSRRRASAVHDRGERGIAGRGTPIRLGRHGLRRPDS